MGGGIYSFTKSGIILHPVIQSQPLFGSIPLRQLVKLEILTPVWYTNNRAL